MNKTKKMTTMALLCALSYIAMFISRFLPPLFVAFPFLKYDPKDAIIVIGGFLYGPLSAFTISLVVSLIEMISVSGTHIIGCFMNIASTCAFACTAAVIYKKYRSLKGGSIGLLMGTISATATMLVLNYLLTPIYTGMPREAVAGLLIPAILPFNLIKCVFNSALVMLIYKPVVKILRRSGILEPSQTNTKGTNKSVILAAVLLILVCALAVAVINR